VGFKLNSEVCQLFSFLFFFFLFIFFSIGAKKKKNSLPKNISKNAFTNKLFYLIHLFQSLTGVIVQQEVDEKKYGIIY